MRSAFVHLQPPHDTVVRKVFGDPGFGDPEMFGQLRLEGRFPTTCGTATKQIGNSHTKGLASLDVVVSGQVRIREQPDTRACRR